MMPSRINALLTNFYKRPKWNCRMCTAAVQTMYERDPAPLFFDQHVQELLTTLTRIDYLKVFAARRDGTPLEVPQYKFMTNEELEEVQSKISMKAKGRIQMPPVVKMRSDKVDVVSNDSAIQAFNKHNFLFTDISYGTNNKERLILVREPNGLLRYANSKERHRMNQVYFPIPGREIHTPQMFCDPHLSNLLDKNEFEFILDRACLQFEPDDPEYHRVTGTVYTYVNKLNKFDALRSTRHFGPFTFYLVWQNNFNALLLDVIHSNNIVEAAALIRLYYKLHPEVESAAEPIQNDLELVKAYAEVHSRDRSTLQQAIVKYEQIKMEKEKKEMDMKKVHGLTSEINDNLET